MKRNRIYLLIICILMVVAPVLPSFAESEYGANNSVSFPVSRFHELDENDTQDTTGEEGNTRHSYDPIDLLAACVVKAMKRSSDNAVVHMGTKSSTYRIDYSYFEDAGITFTSADKAEFESLLDDAKSAWGSKISLTKSSSSSNIIQFADRTRATDEITYSEGIEESSVTYRCFGPSEASAESAEERGSSTGVSADADTCVYYANSGGADITHWVITIYVGNFTLRSENQKKHVLVHEIGHAYGLAHSGLSDSVMKQSNYSVRNPSTNDSYGMNVLTHTASHSTSIYTYTYTDSSTHLKACSHCSNSSKAESHTLTSWSYYNATQHRRQCTLCKRYMYQNHSYGSKTYYSSTQHRQKCSGCSNYKYENHSWQHSGDYLTCSGCGYEKPIS